MSLFEEIGLSDDYEEDKDPSGLGKFLSKPSPKPYQPFGGQMPQAQNSIAPPANPEPYYGPEPQNTIFDDGLGVYEQAKSTHAHISREASAFNQSASLYEDRYDDFMKNKLMPYYESIGGFAGGFETDDEYMSALDQMYKDDMKLSQADDGFFGESDEKKLAKSRLGKYGNWNQPNGLRDQYLRLKQERDFRRQRADELHQQKIDLMDQMTAIPMPARIAMDEQLKARGKAPRSQKLTNEMLDQFSFEDPVVGLDGEVQNLERTDPRKPVSPIKSIEGKASKSSEAQNQRMAAAVKGDMRGFLGKRQLVDKERQLRNKGVMQSQDGLQDGSPRGLSRNDVDLLDIDKMRKAGIKSYKGQPLDTAFTALGGEERLQLAKILEAVYSAKSNFQDAQLKYLRVAGAKGSDVYKTKMDEAREGLNNTIGLAAEFGLDNELFEQADTVGWFAGIGNAIKKGYGMSKMAKYTPDFLTNTLDQDEIQEFIDIVSDMEDLPEYSGLKRYHQLKSKGGFEAVTNLLFNFEVIPHMFVESMASFLPATFNWAMKITPAAAAAGAVTAATRGKVRGDKILPSLLKGAKVGGSIGLRSSWAAASLNLEVAGEIMSGMQELGIDAKDPFIFAAAWNNEITRNAIKKKALKKGVPIAILDGISAGLAGKMVGLREIGLNGGKLINGASWAENIKYGEAIAPRFTKWQKTANVATEVGADSALGSVGELLGQAWSKESGEAWDWDAIAAEGIIGVGPGVFGGFMEGLRSSSNDFSTAPIQYSEKEINQDGETGTINRAGFKRRYQTYNSADGMTSAILRFAGIDESNMNNIDVGPKVAAVQDWIANMWISDPEGMSNLRIVFSDRTTKADLANEGTFEVDDDGNGVMYIKKEDLQNDPIGVFMHEIGHFARQSLFPETETLIDLYDSLSSDEKLQAFAEYYKKIPGKKLNSFSEAEQKDIRKAYNKFTKGGIKAAAEEWFSYQFVRLLAGGQVNPALKSDMQTWLKAHAFPFLEKFAGSEQVAGSKKDILSYRILSYMGRTPRGFDANTPRFDNMPGSETDFNTDGIRAPDGATVLDGLSDMEGLNFLVSKIKEQASTVAERVKLAKDVNTYMGKYVVPTDRKYFTDLQTEVAAAQEAEINDTIMPRVRELNSIISDKNSPEAQILAAKEELAALNEQRDASTSDTGYDTRRLAELLARANIEEMSALDFAEQEVTETSKDGSGERAPKEPVRLKDGVLEEVVVKQPGKPNENLPLGTRSKKKLVVRRDDGTTRDLTEEEKEMLGLTSKDGKDHSPKGGVEVGRPNKPGRKEFEAGKRFRVTMVMPGNNQTNSRIEYFNTREEAQKAKEDFEYKNNTQRIKRVLKKQEEIKDMLLNPDKLFEKAEKAREKLEKRKEEVSTLAIIAEALDLKGMMNDSIFGSSFADMHLAEDKVRAVGEKEGSVKTPSMKEIQESLYLADQELENAMELIQNRESELLREIDQLKEARRKIIGADKQVDNAEDKTAKDKPAQDYSRTEIIQLRGKGKGKGYEIHKFVKGKGFTKDRDLTIAEYNKIKPFIRELGDTKDIPKERLDLLNKKFLPNFKKKVPEKYHNQIAYWLKGSGKAKDAPAPIETKEEEKKLRVDEQIEEAEQVLKNLRELKDTIVPEQKSIDWRDTPHPYIFIDKGKTRITLGQLASQRSELKDAGNVEYYMQVQKGNKRFYNRMYSISNPQQTLIETIQSFNPETFRKNEKAWVKEAGLTVEEYILHMEAVEAAMINPFDSGMKPMGDLRTKQGEERTDSDIGGFTVDKGTNYYLLAAHKLNKKFKEKGGERIPFVGTTPTTEALAMYEVANGRLYENMGGDISFRAQHRYQLLVQRMADHALKKARQAIEEMQEKGSTDPTLQKTLNGYFAYFKKLIPSPDEIGSYAEENVYFPQILGGSAPGKEGMPRGQDFGRAFANWLYFSDMQKVIDDYLEWEYVERLSVVPGSVKFSVGRDPTTGESMPSLKQHLEHVRDFYEAQAAKSKSKFEEARTEKPVFGDFDKLDTGIRPREDTIFVSPDGEINPQEVFEFIEPGEDPNTKIPAREGVHEGFRRGAVDEPINVMDLIREAVPRVFGPLQETLGTRVPTRWETSAILDYVTPEPGTKVSYEYVDDMDVEITKDGQISRTRKEVAPSKAIKKGTVEWRLDEFGEGAWYYANNQKAKTFLTAFKARAKTKNKGPDVEFTAKAPIRVLTPLGRAIEDAWMTEVEKTASAGDADGNSVTLASIAEKLLVRMDSVRDLGMIPSSKDKKDRTGGPAGGMLFFAYEGFLKAAYKKLGIKEFETKATVLEHIEPLADDQRDVEYQGKPHKLIIDANGAVGLYEVKSDGLGIVVLEGDGLEVMVETHFGKSSKEVVKDLKAQAKDQKPEEQTESEETSKPPRGKFKEVTIRYAADKLYVDGKLVEGSAVYENGIIPQYDYIVNTLAPLMQAVIDARRVDLYETSTNRDDSVTIAMEPGKIDDPDKSKDIDDNTPEGLFDNAEREPDLSKDSVQREDPDSEQLAEDNVDSDAPIDSIMRDRVSKALDKAGKRGDDIRKRVWLLKKESRGKTIPLSTVINKFRNDPTLWNAFGLNAPPVKAGPKNIYMDGWRRKLLKDPKFAYFKKRVMEPSEPLGSGFSRRGFLKSLVMGAAASNLKAISKMAGAEPVEVSKAAYSALAKQVQPILQLFGRVEAARTELSDLDWRNDSSMRNLEEKLALSLMDRDPANPPADFLNDEQFDASLEGIKETLDQQRHSPVQLFGLKPHHSDFINPFYEPIPGKKLRLSKDEQKALLQNLEDVVAAGTKELETENLYQDLFEAKRKWNLLYLKTGDPVLLDKARETQNAIDTMVEDSPEGRGLSKILDKTTPQMERSAKYLGVPTDLEEYNNMTSKQLEKVAKNMGFLDDIVVSAEAYDMYPGEKDELLGAVDMEDYAKFTKKPLDPKVVKRLLQVQKRHDNKEIKDELKRAIKALKTVAGFIPADGAKPKLSDNTKKILQAAQVLISATATKAKKEADKVTDEIAQAANEPLALENEAVKGNEINIEPKAQDQGEKVEVQKPKDEDKQTLGSSFTLTAGLPDDYAGSARFLSRLSSKVGLDEEGREQLKEYINKKFGDNFNKSDFVSTFMDQSRPATRVISENLKKLGIDNKKVVELFDIKGLWHQYYGKTDEVVRQADLQYIRPIYDAMREHGVTQQEWGEYLMARRAPSMNIHDRNIYENMIKDLEETKPDDYEARVKSLKETLDKRGDMLSGIATDIAIEAVKKYESMDHFKKFLDDSRNPLQKFYDLNREGLRYRAEGNLIQVEGDINEEKAMVNASSTFNWKKDGGSRYMYQFNGKDSSYSYAPMQGFYDETQTLKDNDRAYEQTGKTSKSTGRAWDQPKHKFLFKGAFGRTSENAVGPDPMMTFAVAQDQFFDGAIRAHKNDVANAFGAAFEMFRAIAYYGEKATKGGEPIRDLESFEGGKELKRKIEEDPTIIEQAKDMFEGENAVFRKEFKRLDAKMDYKIVENAVELENGEKVAGLKVYSREINQEYQNDPLVFVYRKNGVPHYIQFAKNEGGARVAASMKNLKYEALPTMLQKANWVTRGMASMFTSRNPAFIIPNFFRDLGTAAIHLTEDDKKEFVGQALNPKRLGPIMRAIFEVERKGFKGEATMLDLPKSGDSSRDYVLNLIQNNEWQKVYQVAKQAGARVGYFKLDTIPELIDNIQNELDKKTPDNKRVFKNFLSYLDASNTAVENSIRISSFVAAVESGRSIHEAANISRNVTVDFNQKGNMTQAIGSLFVFFGAGMNSIDRMWRTFASRTPEQRWALIGSLAGASLALNLFNRILSEAFGDDEDVVTDYDKISHYKRDTNAILTVPGTSQQLYMPIPLGYNMFWALGQTAADYLWRVVNGRGGAGPADFVTRNMEASMNAWTPFGASNFFTIGVPTMFKPVVELGANTNFMGHNIKYEDDRWGAKKPAHLLDPKRTNDWFTAASKGINSLLGGSDHVKGTVGGLFGGDPIKGAAGDDLKWNISGSQMEHLLLGYLGGPGQIINSLFSSTAPIFLEESKFGELDAAKVPIVSRFYRNTYSNYYLNNMFNQLRDMHDTANDVVKASKAVGGSFAAQKQKDMKDFLAIGKKLKYAEALRKEIRVKTDKIKSSKMPEIQKRQRIDQLEKKEQDAYKAAIKQAQKLGLI